MRNASKEEECEQEGSGKKEGQREKIQPQGVRVSRARDEGDEAGKTEVGTQREEGYKPQAGNRDRPVGSTQVRRKGSGEEVVVKGGWRYSLLPAEEDGADPDAGAEAAPEVDPEAGAEADVLPPSEADAGFSELLELVLDSPELAAGLAPPLAA
jgi:hypothetical protein